MSVRQAVEALEWQELLRHRGLVRLSNETLTRMADLDSGYQVVGVHADFMTESVLLAVVHPDLHEVPEGGLPPLLNVGVEYQPVFRVVDGEVYERARMVVPAPDQQPVAELAAQLTDMLAAPGVHAQELCELLSRVARAGGAPYRASAFVAWLSSVLDSQ